MNARSIAVAARVAHLRGCGIRLDLSGPVMVEAVCAEQKEWNQAIDDRKRDRKLVLKAERQEARRVRETRQQKIRKTLIITRRKKKA